MPRWCPASALIIRALGEFAWLFKDADVHLVVDGAQSGEDIFIEVPPLPLSLPPPSDGTPTSYVPPQLAL